MKAAITPNYGAPQILRLEDRPEPKLAPDEVLVEVGAAAVTEGDRRLRSADFPGISALPGRFMMGLTRPKNEIQGTMFAGRVVEVGPTVTRFAVGDRVFGSVDHGAYAGFAKASEGQPVALMPPKLRFDEAASVPYGAITALHFLRDLAQVQPGEHVLVIGASGGVGQYAVQIAKHLNARVTAVCSAENIGRVLDLGADHAVDYRGERYLKGDEFYDVIFDISGTKSFWQSRRALKENGRYLTLLVSITVLVQMAVTAILGGKRAIFGVAIGNPAQMQDVADLLEAGQLRPTVGAVFPFQDIVQAHEAVQGRLSAGTVVVQNDDLKSAA